MDDIDKLIVEELEPDAHQLSRQLAIKLGIPNTTINRRINKLLKGNHIHIIALPKPG